MLTITSLDKFAQQLTIMLNAYREVITIPDKFLEENDLSMWCKKNLSGLKKFLKLDRNI
jgi:hypothetical protein